MLNCSYTKIKKIPKELVNLNNLICYTKIKFIPDTLKIWNDIFCYNEVLISPKTHNILPNNKRYLTFTNCQKRYKYRLRLYAKICL